MKVLGGKIEDDKAYFGGKNKGKRGRGSKNKVIVLEYLKKLKVCVLKYLQMLLQIDYYVAQ
jgi:hypothetical protein